jgi:hypothetical protein
MIKTFRGILADLGQQRIRLSTKKGKIGYKIVNFQIIGHEPGEKSQESLVKIFKVKQSSVTGIVDFSDGNLLGVAYWAIHPDPQYGEGLAGPIIFEQEVFNQDIYITHKDMNVGELCSYYLELETFVQTDNQAAVSTLRDIRLNPQVGA